jgi:hypothetical protein
MYNQQSHAIAFGAGDANRTNFGLLPMSYITQRAPMTTKYEDSPFK